MKRPFSVTILFSLVLSLIVWSSIRLIAIIRWWRIIRVYSDIFWPLYISASAVIWLVVGSILFWGLKRKKAWVQNALIGAGAGYTVWFWCDRIFVQWPHANWMFALYATILLLVIGIINVKHPKTIRFFTKRDK